MEIEIKKFDICLVQLNPGTGSELNKVRPCLIISPDSMNLSRLKTIIIAPMTTVIRDHFPTRVNIEFAGKKGQVALDQLRAIDRERIIKHSGSLTSQKIKNEITRILQVMFA